jgi:uncharacterized RDD family membrane protein YckC
MSEQPPPPPPGQAPPPWYEPPPSFPTAGRPGDLGARFVAKLIDGLLVALALSVVSAVLGLAAFGMGMRSGYGTDLLSTLTSTAVVVGYYAFLESTRGQTVGKMILRLRVQNLEGENPTMEQALRRNAYLAISLIGILPLVGAFITGLAMLTAVIYVAVTINDDTQTRRGWHDRFGDTQVVTVS